MRGLGSVYNLYTDPQEKENALIVEPRSVRQTVVSDPTDDSFSACVLGADCRIIVSGDRQVLAASGYEGVGVFRPRSFTERHL